MAEEDDKDAAPVEEPRRFNKFVVMGFLGLVAVAAAGVFAARLYVQEELKRETQAWQVRLGIVADSRIAAVTEWIDGNFQHIRDLAENASLQLYLSEIKFAAQEAAAPPQPAAPADGGGDLLGLGIVDQPAAEPAEEEQTDDAGASVQYLRNLLIATAERTGFKAPPPVGEVAANVERAGVAGIGLVDADGKPLVATPDMPPMTGKIRTAVAQALDGEPAVIDVFLAASGEPTMGFVLPIYGIQAEEGAKGIGAVVGVKILDRTLWDRLKQPGELLKSSETYLIRGAGARIEYLSPLKDGTLPLKRSLSADSPNLFDAYAIERPGGFANQLDYTGTRVLAVSRAVPGVPWILVRKVSRDEALAATENRLNVIMGVFIAMIVIVTLVILFVWKKGASARATEALHEARVMLERFENMTKFMNVVTNNQPTQIVAVDRETHYTFANQPAWEAAGMESREDMFGKTMSAVMGPVKAQFYAEINKRVIDDFDRQQHVRDFGDPEIDDPEDENCFQVIKSDHIPLRGDRDYPPGCLMVLDDITEITRVRMRSEKRMKELIDTLVSVVDRRDPYSANHSARVAEVSCAIAREMGLGEIEAGTLDIAGSLMNLGKIFIPEETLTKTDKLTDEERMMLQNAYLTTVDLIENVTFDGPVVETIRQFGETWDGRGPLGLKGEEIIQTARVLSVANAFVGMVSARAYRQAMAFEKVMEILLKDCETKFDRKPVTALMNFLENRDGKRVWAHFRENPDVGEAAE